MEEPASTGPAAPAAFDPGALRRAGEALQQEVRGVLAAYAARLRTDASLPAAALTDAEVEDHQATLLTDVGQCMVALADAPGEVSLLQDGTEVQRLLAFRHGEQRARLGWDDAGLRREFAALREVSRAALGGDTLPAGTWEVLTRFLNRAEEVSVAALCAARQDDAPDPSPDDVADSPAG